MQRFGLRQFSKTLLTITGIVLLIIFGTRAASQASSLSAAGGQVKKSVGPVNFALGQLMLLRATSTPGVLYAAVSNERSSSYTDEGAVVVNQATTSKTLKNDIHDEIKSTGTIIKSPSNNIAQEVINSTVTPSMNERVKTSKSD